MENSYKIKKIEFQLTTACNMNCGFCFNGQNTDCIKLPTEIICKTIRELYTYKKQHNRYVDLDAAWLTGGEPLLEKNSVVKIVQECNALNINTGLSTNALLLDASLDELINAGLTETRISVDSLSLSVFEKLRGKKNSFAKIIKNVEMAAKSSLKTSVRITVTNENIHEIENIAEEMARLGVSKIELKGVVPVGNADFKMMTTHKTLEQAFNKAVSVIQKNPALRDKTSITVMCSYLSKCEGFFVEPNVSCVCGFSALYVSANGSIIPCSYFPKESAFNIYNDSILDAWQSLLFENIRNKCPEKCKKCSDWNACKNGCPAIIYTNKAMGHSCFDIINKENQSLAV